MMGLIGFKAFAAAALAAALIAGFGMVIQTIKSGERARIDASLAQQRERLAQEADEHLAAANARVYASRLNLAKEREQWEEWRRTHAETDTDRCIVGGDSAAELRSIGADDQPGGADSE